MKKTITDEKQSIQSEEYTWCSTGMVPAHQYLLPTVLKWLKDAKVRRVLDLGCGNAAATKELQANGMNVSGIDSSQSGIALARNAYPGMDLECADLLQPLPDRMRGQYDAVVSLEVIEHLLLPRAVFQRANEALSKDGHIIVSTPFHGYFKNLALAAMNAFDGHWHPLRDYGHIKFFSKKTLCELTQEQGFRLKGFKKVGRFSIFAKSMIIHAIR